MEFDACVGALDATHFSELLAKAEMGQEVTITKHGVPVARLIPMKKKHTLEERREAIDRIVKLSEGLSLGGLEVRDLSDILQAAQNEATDESGRPK
jgi:prevent-host-death family protein